MDKEIKTKQNRENRKGNRKPFKRKDSREDASKVPSKICMNDPSWYVLHPELLKDVASLSFSHWLGRGFPVSAAIGYKPHETYICKIPYLYTLGVASTSGDPVNLAIRNLYTYVRHQNSGHTNYEAADLGMYLLATASIVATLAHIERCVGLAKYYQRRSSVMPRKLLLALGVGNVDTFIANLANFTAQLNVQWSRVSSLCIPKDFSFLQRWIWMNSQVFKDHESDKAALYVFKPVGVPKFWLKATTAGSISQPTSESATPTIQDWMTEVIDALDRVLGDEDMNIMSGDILKAYGRENLLSFGMTSLDYVLEPVYVEEMLPQIMHAQTPVSHATGNGQVLYNIATGVNYEVAQAINDVTDPIYVAAQDSDYFTIYQVNGEIVCTPCPAFPGTSATIDTTTKVLYWGYTISVNDQIAINNQDRLLNSFKDVVPPEDVMISTRLMYVTEGETRVSTSDVPIFYTSCGTELVQKFVLYYQDDALNPNVIGDDSGSFLYCSSTDGGAVWKAILNDIQLKSQLDWAPITYVSLDDIPAPNNRIAGDLDNFTAIAAETLKAQHLTALLAEFSVTQYNLIKG